MIEIGKSIILIFPKIYKYLFFHSPCVNFSTENYKYDRHSFPQFLERHSSGLSTAIGPREHVPSTSLFLCDTIDLYFLYISFTTLIPISASIYLHKRDLSTTYSILVLDCFGDEKTDVSLVVDVSIFKLTELNQTKSS